MMIARHLASYMCDLNCVPMQWLEIELIWPDFTEANNLDLERKYKTHIPHSRIAVCSGAILPATDKEARTACHAPEQ